MIKRLCHRWLVLLVIICSGSWLVSGCSASAETLPQKPASPSSATGQTAVVEILELPQLRAAELNGERLKVVATTSIIGDVVAQVGRGAIDLTVLINTEQDPHSYEPVAQDLAIATAADVIFVNGWQLEESLTGALGNIARETPLIPVAANVEPLLLGSQEQQDEIGRAHVGVDPHTWFSIQNVEQWVRNIEHVLGELDPANAEKYESNAKVYLAELEELAVYAEKELAEIPADRRLLVTNHDSFGYFARDYEFEILGAVIPSISALAEPSANDLVGLIEEMERHGICTIFTETTVNDRFAQTVVNELDGCNRVQVLPLYSGALGPGDSDADNYIGMIKANVDTIVRGLKQE